MSQFIAAKSDQLNAEDLISGPRTITITRVTGNSSAEQPVNIWFEGDDGKPWRPCKTARRIMVRVWGADASKYAGRSLTLYRDPKVKFGGLEVGGIRISHASDISAPVEMALLASQKKMQAVKVEPLRAPATRLAPAPEAPPPPQRTAEDWLADYRAKVAGATDRMALAELQHRASKALDKLASTRPDLHKQAVEAGTSRLAELEGPDDDEAPIDDDYPGDLPFGDEVAA